MNIGSKTKNFVIIFIVVFISFFIARNDTKSILNILFIKVLAPIQEKITDTGSWAKSQKDAIANISTSFEENKRLQAELSDLREKNLSAVEVWTENQRLRSLLEYKQKNTKMVLATAKVISRSPARMRSEVIINVGALQGIKENMPVVNSDGLVGTVTMVYDNVSKVTLLSNPESSIAAVVQRPASRAIGIVSGELVEDAYLKFGKLARDMDVSVGDVVVTSGLSGLHPKGIFIGEVIEVVNSKDGLLKHAVLKTRVNFDKLEEVMVLTNAASLPDVTPPEILNQLNKAANALSTTNQAVSAPAQPVAPAPIASGAQR